MFTVPRHNVPPAAEDLPLVVLRGLRLLRAVLQAQPRPLTSTLARVCGPQQLQPEEKLPGTAQAVQPPDRQGGETGTEGPLTSAEAEKGQESKEDPAQGTVWEQADGGGPGD